MPAPDPFVARSLELQRILTAAGYGRHSGSGVTYNGLKLVSLLAQENDLRDWPDVRTVADYDALIAAVRAHLDARR